MRIAISGSTGLLGSALAERLASLGHEVLRLVRRPAEDASEISYDIASGLVDVEALGRADAVVHLAGENVGDSRWSARKKERIRSSRVQSTRLIATALAECSPKPRAFICASAVGIYGERGDEWLDEESARGDGFLADVCDEWEQACAPAKRAGIRTVNTRFGVVMSLDGGALAKMITPFKLGLGGAIGSGEQWMSWISLDDTVGALVHLVLHSSLEGAVNLVAPEPITNGQLSSALGRHLRRPALLPMPAFAARLVFGERADALLLASARIRADKLQRDGFRFRHPDIDEALAEMLHTTSVTPTIAPPLEPHDSEAA